MRSLPSEAQGALSARLFSAAEELAHAITHGLGALLAVAGLCVLVVRAALYGTVWHVVACSVYGATLVAAYAASTVYHSLPHSRAKAIFRVVDHSMIFVLIAGTYTPFVLTTLRGPWGWSLFGVTWGLTAVGIVFKLFATGRFERLSLAIYLAMGWCVLVAIRPLAAALPRGGLVLLAAGGLAYSAGVVFYAWRSLPYHHAVWHIFVLAGSALHYAAVLAYVVP